MGCLTAPFKLVGCLGLIILLGIGWLYRDRILREGRRLLQGDAPNLGISAHRLKRVPRA